MPNCGGGVYNVAIGIDPYDNDIKKLFPKTSRFVLYSIRAKPETASKKIVEPLKSPERYYSIATKCSPPFNS